METLENKILAFLARTPNELYKTKELGRRLGCRSKEEYQAFAEALHRLQETHQIARMKGKQFKHLHIAEDLTGVLAMARPGFGIVTVEGTGEEIFVPPGDLGEASHGDTVRVSLFPRSSKKQEKGTRREGEIIKVLKRGRMTLVGTLERQRKTWIVVPDDSRMGTAIVVAPKELGKAKEGDKVVVEPGPQRRRDEPVHGTIVEVLGPAGDMRAEIRSVIREFNLPVAFPPEVLAESERIPAAIPREEILRRLDLRKEICFTIDPEDAKDFDDAVSIDPLPNGSWRVGVHIADVSHYVREQSALDAEALKRGTSVYVPNGVVPMLPENLSNHLCSLRPGEDKLTFSVLMEVTPTGTVPSFEIKETVIRSKRRYTYEEAQAIIDGSAKGMTGDEAVFAARVLDLQRLAAVLTKKRMREGSIDFESAEAKFRFDADGLPIEVLKKTRLASHRLVEEFMLMANRMVARHIGLPRKEEHPKPFLYRIHDSPDPDRVGELAKFVEQFGFHLDIESGVTSKALQKLLDQVRGTEVENVINEVALRSMAKAIYSDRNIGHYGLAFDFYSHFTSPIRRYPDMVIHRLLKRYAAGISEKEREAIRMQLPYVAKQSSDMERRAMEAERASVKVMQVEYMKRHLGDEFQAVVSGVVKFGFFVEINDLLVEGMIHVRDLNDDFYEFDEKQYALVGRRNGKRFRLGDTVHVKVLRVNPEERQIDFVLVAEEEPRRTGRKRRGTS